MDQANYSVMLYTAQRQPVLDALERDGVCFSQKSFIEQKYEESAPIFLAAYGWFAREAQQYCPKPDGAEYPYWVFPDLRSVERYDGERLLRLRVPIDEVIYFDMFDWHKILSLRYLGETDEEERRFRQQLTDYGVKQQSDVILTNFYPELKRQMQESWQRLFCHHEELKHGNRSNVNCPQAAVWCLKKEWLVTEQ